MKHTPSTIAEIGEFSLIDRIKKILPKVNDPQLLVDIGDDAALIKVSNQRAFIITCDIQIEGQHFRREYMSPYQIGQRAIAVNLSDIAAMGGIPRYALVSLGLPPSLAVEEYDSLFCGMKDELYAASAAIIGGNLARSADKLIVDITLLGEVNLPHFRTRSGARAGDRIVVSGKLGASGAGFEVLQKYGMNYPEKFRPEVEAHIHPQPRIELGKELAQLDFVTAMIDISDGLAGDLYHICEMSNVGAVINFDQLPLAENIHDISSMTGTSVFDLALHSGEDYELLFTVHPEASKEEMKALSDRLSLPLTEIGKILPAIEDYYVQNNKGEKIALQPKGWDHFVNRK